jgi:molybdate transport system permease protein
MGAGNMWSWDEFVTPILLSIKITVVSSSIVLVLGVFAAWYMTRRKFPGRFLIETIFLLPIVLPPTVVGFLLLLILGRNSFIGRWIENLFGQPLVFTWWAAMIASVVVAFPLVYQTAKAGLLSVSQEIQEAARSQGANEWQVLYHITVPLSYRSLLSAYILGFARSLGEFGATIMVAGDIPGKTETVPTAIYTAVDSGHLAIAGCWVAAMIVLSICFLLIANRRAVFD